MNTEIRNHVEQLFEITPTKSDVSELKEELINNLESRYNDLVASGMSEAAAYKATIDSIGDIKELVGYSDEEKETLENDVKNDAVFKTICTALYFFAGIVFLGIGITSENLPNSDMITAIGFVVALIIAMVPTCMIVYRHTLKAKNHTVANGFKEWNDDNKSGDTVVEEFTEWNVKNKRESAILSAVQTLLWLVVVTVYLAISFFTMKWHITWLIFLIGVIIDCCIVLGFETSKRSRCPNGSFGYNKAQKAIKGNISAIIWVLAVIVYFLVSFSTMAWYITWMVFIIAACVQSISNLILTLSSK